ncbi:MAG: protein kinase domain-containing protein, partial [Streptosporangiales bacterium]
MTEPGSVLDGRYRLDERVGEQGRAGLWRGTDTLLARAVTVWIAPSAAAEAADVLTAARRAARVSDPRVVDVVDMATVDEVTYVVTEAVTGDTLTNLLLHEGPLPPARAGGLIREAAEALAAAHHLGVTHLHLHPDNLVCTTADEVKVTGVAVEAALAGVSSDDPARADAQGLGALLYAALTARWPYGAYRGLPAAPHGPGAPRPHQVRADIPAELDAATARALSAHPTRGRPALTSP